jgi:hypothetical protein
VSVIPILLMLETVKHSVYLLHQKLSMKSSEALLAIYCQWMAVWVTQIYKHRTKVTLFNIGLVEALP